MCEKRHAGFTGWAQALFVEFSSKRVPRNDRWYTHSMPNKKKLPKRKARAKKTVPKKKVARKQAASKKSPAARKKSAPKRDRTPRRGQGVATVAFRSGESRQRRAGQSGDIQGLSGRPIADSESVEELLEEGNALEAEVVEGVEDAPDADQGEVRTKEVPEDDVPEEYLDNEQ